MNILDKTKICHLTTVHDPLDDRIFHRECVTLVNAGYDVVLIAPAERSGDLEGVRLRAIPKPTRRLDRMTKTAWSAFRSALRENADVYHLHDPELLPCGFALRAAGKRVVYDAHEDMPDDAVTKSWVPPWLRFPLACAMTVITWLTGLVCSGVVAATPRIAKRFPNAKTALVANYPVSEELLTPPRAFAQRSNTLVYVGSLTATRGLTQMVDALIDPAMPPGIRLVIAGSFGSSGADLEQRARSLPGWKQVDFLGWQSRAAVRNVLQSGKIGLILLHPQPSFLDSLPTKLFEYMAAGMPVIASDFPLWRRIIEGAGCGILVDPLDTKAIATAAAALLDDPARAEAMGLRGRQAVISRYSWHEQADRLLKLYARLLPAQQCMAVSHG